MVVGGGTAGWLSAAILARKLATSDAEHIQVTLVESPDIPTIGVGEGTFPTMVETLKYLGINEATFMRRCSATFKQAIKFCDWEYPASTGKNHYYHLFDAPFKSPDIDLQEAWLYGLNVDVPYAYSVAGQAAVCDAGLGPKKFDTASYIGLTKYAYHFDAGKFAELLAEHAVKNLGVTHIKATVLDALRDENGFLVGVNTAEIGVISADFFIDCTGFSSLLLGKTLAVPFIDKSSVLFVDHAVTMQVPYSHSNHPIACHTISTAHEAGWTWDIGLSERRGIGYVYSSAHTSHEAAELTLRNYIGREAENFNTRQLSMRVGYRAKMWEKNCVAIGLSAGFMEPLEATAIAMVETSAILLAAQFPRTWDSMAGIAIKFNNIFCFRWEKIVDFIKLHYFLSKRTDSQFWKDNREITSVPESLQEKLMLWRGFRPIENDFPNRFELFSLASYEYILYGLNFRPGLSANGLSEQSSVNALKTFEFLNGRIKKALAELPMHRELIEFIYRQDD